MERKREIDCLGLMIWLCFHKNCSRVFLRLIPETLPHFHNKPLGLLPFSFTLLDTMAIIWTAQTFVNAAPDPKII